MASVDIIGSVIRFDLPHEDRIIENNIIIARNMIRFFMTILSELFSAQRLAAQPVPRAMSIGDPPMRRIRERGLLGRPRLVFTILTGKQKSYIGVRSLSLG
jgi:hypothetical protein